MSGGTSGTDSGLRATINAWLEDISFRTGVITGVVALLVVAAAGAAVAVLSHGGQAASALGSRGTANPATVAAPSAGVAAQPTAAPSSAAPARSARATPARATPARATPAPAPAPARSAAAGSGTAAVASASDVSRERYGPASPDGWRHGFPSEWGGRGWVWGPYRGGTYFRGARPGRPAAPERPGR